MARAKILDFSKWQSWVNAARIKEVFDPDLIVIRLGIGLQLDPTFEIFYKQLKDAGFRVGVYYVWSPYYSAAAQIEFVRQALAGKEIAVYASDLELHGGYSRSYLQTSFFQFHANVRYEVPQIRALPSRAFWLYSAKWYTDAYFGYPSWFSSEEAWNANYAGIVVYPADYPIYQENVSQPWTTFSQNWIAWQFAEKMVSDGCAGSATIDASVSRDGRKQFLLDIGQAEEEEPPPSPELPVPIKVATIAVLALNVRSGAGTGFYSYGTLAQNAKVYVFEVTDVSGLLWGRIGVNAWIAISSATRAYALLS